MDGRDVGAASSPPSPADHDRLGPDPLLERLFPRLAPGIEWGLDRVEAVLATAGDPHVRYPVVHVGGTNGKGTVAALVASALRAHGLRTGLYTSPHVRAFRERYRIDGRAVADEALLEAAGPLRKEVERRGLTAFEAATVLGFRLFALEAVEAAVVEVGLGGRLDATNVVRPEVTAVTNVSRDHAAYLGSTLPEIAAEKAGIMKREVPFVTAETDPACLEVFRRSARTTGARLVPVDPERELLDVRTGLDGTAFTADTAPWGRLGPETPLPGRHQAVNGLVALRALERLEGGLLPSARAVTEGFRSVRWPGRLQVERWRDGTWVFDVAHNEAGVRTLAGALESLPLPEPLVLVVGILGDKEWAAMLPPLLRLADAALLTTPDSVSPERAWDPAAALSAVRDQAEEGGEAPGGRPYGCPVRVTARLADALREARSRAGEGTVVVAGSHYTVGDALRMLEPDGDLP